MCINLQKRKNISMSNKHFILIGLIISIIFIVIATLLYPGGSQNDINSVGFKWQHNYVCNLFADTAMNGMKNKSKYWAVTGMLFMTVSFAIFFYQTSKKVAEKSASNVIKYCGVSSMLLAFLVVTPLHDIVLNISNILALLSLFYIVVFIFRSKNHFFLKAFSIILMIISYMTIFIYYSGYLIAYLPVMQKVSFLILVSWMLGVTYFFENRSDKN